MEIVTLLAWTSDGTKMHDRMTTKIPSLMVHLQRKPMTKGNLTQWQEMVFNTYSRTSIMGSDAIANHDIWSWKPNASCLLLRKCTGSRSCATAQWNRKP